MQFVSLDNFGNVYCYITTVGYILVISVKIIFLFWFTQVSEII